jgi:uncharacterized protein (DUF1697 family)
MPRQIALLRGINVGKHRRIAMGDLRELLDGLGYEDVRTHLQSGNVLLSSRRSSGALERELAEALAERFAMDIPVIVRTRAQLADVVERNPLTHTADDPRRYLVTFLSAKPAATRVRALANLDFAPEQFVISGREIYAWHPDGLQRSRLAAALSDADLGVTGTSRNWNTVTKLLELVSE